MKPTLRVLIVALSLLLFGQSQSPLFAEDSNAIDFNRAKEIYQKAQRGEKLSAEDQAYLERAKAARRQQDQGAGQQPGQGGQDGIDWERAQDLFQRSQRGEKLTDEQQAYLDRAKAARAKGGNQGGPGAALGKPSVGLVPLTELTGEYKGQDGGLYGGGKNEPPAGHAAAAAKETAKTQPLDREGKPSPQGRIVFVSISMSNATQEFSRFKQIADADPQKSPLLTIVDCAQGGQAMAEWVSPAARPWTEAENRIRNAGVTLAQVQVAWVKLANKGPRGDLAEHGGKLQQDTLQVLQNAKARFPNLRIIYLGSRIYGGWSGGALNPEPYAYEGAFPVRWLIQAQIKGDAALNYDARFGEVKAPLLLWGPYFWADGTTPRKSDGLVWERKDLGPDGTHPSDSGRQKVADMLLNFLKSDSIAKTWFVKK